MAPNDVPPDAKKIVAGAEDAPSSETRSFADTGDKRVEDASGAAHQWVGKRLGKYDVTGVIGWGGMGFVLKAYDSTLERDVAIKVLPKRLAEDPNYIKRFRSEAKAAGKLSNANVAAIYEIGEEDSVHYLAMELLSGGGVAEYVEKHGALSPLESTQIMIDACQGIAAAHSAGLVHRDIKPANLVRAKDRSVKVTDFGLAKHSSSVSNASQLTQTGIVIGTPYFMSPEQCQAKEVDARSDVYSLGATYYSLLAGQHPYQECDSAVAILIAHCQNDIPDPRLINSAIPQACSAIIARAMAKSPDDRYQSVTEMLADLRALAATLSGEIQIDLPSQSGATLPKTVLSQPKHSGRRLMIGGIGVVFVLAICGLAAWSFWDASPPIPQGDPIKVGVLQSLSGTMSTSGTSVIDATLLAIEEINASGGLLGRPVEAVVADGKSNTQTYASEAERLIVEERVSTVFGCWTSASRKTVKPIFEEHDHLLIYPVQYEGMETSPNIIYLGAAPNQQFIPAVNWANESLGKKRFFLVGSDYVFPRAASEVIKDQLKKMDAELVGEVFVPLGSSEFKPVVQEIVDANPDMILIMVAGDSNIACCHALRAAGIKQSEIPALSFTVGEQELRSLGIADVEGDYVAQTYFQSVDTAENQAFVQRFTKKNPHHVISDPMQNAYVGVHLWAQAVREAESIEPRKICRAMLNQRLAAPEGNVRIDPDTQHCFKTPRVGQIQDDGQIGIVWSGKEPIRPEPFPASRTAADWKAFLHDLYASWGNEWVAPTTD